MPKINKNEQKTKLLPVMETTLLGFDTVIPSFDEVMLQELKLYLPVLLSKS